ncbi:unnamed protein product [Durusdinium trenchii]|uniref:Uncharacterized protein n=1 Tax=Durusdinium trenchii TaxID=1381693 RepID=A0ABP0L738_9DINO
MGFLLLPDSGLLRNVRKLYIFRSQERRVRLRGWMNSSLGCSINRVGAAGPKASTKPVYEFQLPPYFLNNARALGCLEVANGAYAPNLRMRGQRLCEDDLGHLCLAKADELVASAARLSGKRKHDVVMDSLRTKGGRRFFRKLLRNEIRVRWSRSRSLAAAPRAEPSSGTRGEKTVALPAGPVVSESYDLWLAGLRHAASIRVWSQRTPPRVDCGGESLRRPRHGLSRSWDQSDCVTGEALLHMLRNGKLTDASESYNWKMFIHRIPLL